MPAKYGIYDTVDHCWIGDNDGPNLCENYTLQRLAAEVTEHQLYGTRVGRLKATPFGDHPLKFKDSVNTKMSGEQAIKEIEDGL